MDRTKVQRRIVQGLFTKCASKLKSALDTPTNHIEIEASFTNLKEKHDALNKLDNAILGFWLDMPDRDNDAYEADLQQTEEYVEQWHLLSQQYNAYRKDVETLKGSETKTDINGASQERLKCLFKLPKLELPKFDGDVHKWLFFWEIFEKIHRDEEMEDDVKFQYLSQCMEPGTPPQKLIESYAPTADNYSKAVEDLRAGYGRDELLIEIYVRELISIVLEQCRRGARSSVATLYDKLKMQLHALEYLGVTRDKYAAMLYPLVESALPIELLKVWERHNTKNSDLDQANSLTNLLEVLKKEAESEEIIKMSRKKFTTKEPSASGFATGVKPNAVKVKICIFCDKICHASRDCEDAKKMTKEERSKAIKSKRGCTICLNEGHWYKVCKNKHKIKCTICGRRHYAVMCYSAPSTAAPKCAEGPENLQTPPLI